jgi:hypothetical protein
LHVTLTVNAEGSQGADVKHKVFWVTGCIPAPTTTTTTGGTTTTTKGRHHNLRGDQGGFNWWSQHLEGEELRWEPVGVNGLIGRCVLNAVTWSTTGGTA